MAIRDDIRYYVLVQGHSQRAAAKRFGIARDTVARMLGEPAAEPERRYQRRKPRPAPVRDQVLPHLERWLEQNEQLKRTAPKQRWTAHRMWLELRSMGIEVAESTVRMLVRQRKQVRRETFVPLAFGPGERAEFDFGHALVILGGKQVELPFLAGRLRFSGASWVEFFPTERRECFLLGQRHAFEFWGGVPSHCLYDNTKTAVKEILRGHERVEQDAFRHFRSYYLFESVFANPSRGNEKGSVENLVGEARRNFMVPIPQADTIEELNQNLREACSAHLERTMAGRTEPVGKRLAVERPSLRPLPERSLAIEVVREVVASSTSQVTFQTNQYSVPTTCAYEHLTLKADPFRVRVYRQAELVAEHPRSYERRQVVDDWRHYLPLLLRKPAAVPFAAPLRGHLPASWETFRKQLAASKRDGNREFARVLELCLSHPVEEVGAAIELAVSLGSSSADAVQALLSWANEAGGASEPLDPARYPQYQRPQPAPDISVYNRLLEV
ncbi:IS21 family transposase [Nitrolancea hollandica]|uniref:Transposase n=1 Tax=Nitrolancea hollandica Lb TaxID=1129897 RepID=I4EMJ4_9BACT|nr:IS21 family transposase [Nitrolancea hollandica]CCF85907.1 transposase [Nitrolancea hollandica Lb]